MAVGDEHVLIIHFAVALAIVVFVVVVKALATGSDFCIGANHFHVVVAGITESDVHARHLLVSTLSGCKLARLDEVELTHAVGMTVGVVVVVDDLIAGLVTVVGQRL
jgi:hypothetical protein